MKLLNHPLDITALCPRPSCPMSPQRYDAAVIVLAPEGSDHEFAEARQYTCQCCGNTYYRDYEPLAGLTEVDLCAVRDLRAWHWTRKAVAA